MTLCSLGLLPTFRGRKNLLFDKEIRNFTWGFQKKIKLEFSKSSDLFWLNQFQLKIKKSGRCHNLANGRIPLVEFLRQPLMEELVSHVIRIFCLYHAFDKINTWKLIAYGKIHTHWKINRRKSPPKRFT